jgi:DNA-binding transcriptional MerR regulator
MPKQPNLLKIGQLAQKAGVKAATIKHYLNEGLLPKPVKTSRNMAYYDESCIERIGLIKKIQKEKFLPLGAIKQLIDAGESCEEELEFGRAILKSQKIAATTRTVKGSQIERRTAYPLRQILLLEEEGLIAPTLKNNVKYYDETDIEIIELVKRREDLGLTFDQSLETIRIYRDAVSRAVNEDIRFFVGNFLGDVPTKQAIKFLTEADEALDRFMVLFRYQKLRSISQAAIIEMNEMPSELMQLNIFPTPAAELPASAPADIFQKVFYYLCRGEYEAIVQFIDGLDRSKTNPAMSALSLISAFLKRDTDDGLATIEKIVPQPTPKVFDNTMAALAYLFSISQSAGLSTPMYHTKKAMAFLKRTKDVTGKNLLVSVFSQYVSGAIYTIFPTVIKTRPQGIALLENLEDQIRKGLLKYGRLPQWMVNTLEFEIFPVLEIKINRFLAQAYRKQGRNAAARRCLQRIVDLADPESEICDWARFERLRLKQRRD